MPNSQLTDNLVIRRASLDDAQLLISLSVTTFVDAFGPANDPVHMQQYLEEEMNDAKLTSELADEHNFFYLAYLCDTAIGYAKLRNAYTPAELEGHHCIEMERIYVLQQYHSQNTGGALMQRCIDHARQFGYDILWLGVWEHNERAIKFYSRWGFTIFGSHIFLLGTDEQTDVLMKKVLNLDLPD